MVVLTEQIEIPASYEKLKAWTANFEEDVYKRQAQSRCTLPDRMKLSSKMT